MSALRTFARAYVRLIETLGILAIGTVAVVAVLQVLFRYVIGASLYWSEELMRYLTIWSVFGVSGLAYSRGEMLGFTVLVDHLPHIPQQVVKSVVRIIVVIFLLVIAWYGFDFAQRTANDRAIALRISMFWVHLSIPVGCVLMAVHVIVQQFLPEPRPKVEEVAYHARESLE
ncbi:TRAP transporter small permease [Chelativorans sp. Marseille-P2723]|uniref:TRAP transporter small permease n=1 Tax=Chelativorans sp. Marseille-P2723 TaxID=2709133 RepID=UPI00157033AF|nr:TRAP transporter small permease [Chelativorans sp. Marseille-P2723]